MTAWTLSGLDSESVKRSECIPDQLQPRHEPDTKLRFSLEMTLFRRVGR
jgi:hypothetical protein